MKKPKRRTLFYRIDVLRSLLRGLKPRSRALAEEMDELENRCLQLQLKLDKHTGMP